MYNFSRSSLSLRLSLWPIQRCGSQARLDCQSAAAYISALQLSQGRIIPPANHSSTPSIHPIHLSVKQRRTPSSLSPPPFKTTPSTEALRSPFNSQTNTHSCTHKHSPSLEHTNTLTMRYRYRGLDTHTHTHTHRHADTAPLPHLHLGLHLSFSSFHHPIQ